MEYGLISVDLDDNLETEQFYSDLKPSNNMYQLRFHNTYMSLYGKPGTSYTWGDGRRKVKMNSINWGDRGARLNRYLENITGMDSDYYLQTEYHMKGSKQPYHDDKNSGQGFTQVVNVVTGPRRVMEVKFKNINHPLKVQLQEGKIYIFTHLFNRSFLHRYIHNNTNVNLYNIISH